ncbi:MAG: AsmA family protein [Ignavibacteriae bacterium]|nr:AsmA family protein [Ignavibacteriota bacterium]
MALSKAAKIWIIILSIPLVLIVGGIIAAKIYFTSDRLKALVIPPIEEATHRTVTVKNISISILPSLAVSIDGLRISNPEDSPFDRNEFMSLDHLKLKVKIFELLQNKLEITHVILDHPRLYLEVTKDGKKNFSSKETGTSEDVRVQVRVEKNSMSALLLSNLEINDGEIEYVNKRFDSRMKIEGWRQTLRAEARPGENILFIEGQSNVDQFSYGTVTSWYLDGQPISVTEKMMYKIVDDVLIFDAVQGTLKNLPLAVSGTISKLQEETIILALAVTSPSAQMTQLLSLIPPDMLKEAQGLSSAGDVKFSLSIIGRLDEQTDPGIQGLFTVSNGVIKYASLHKSITNINLSGKFEKPEAPIDKKEIGSFSIDKLTATLGTNTITGKLHLTNFDDPTITSECNGTINLLEVKDYYPLEPGTELNGLMKADIALQGKAKVPQSIRARGTIELDNVTIKTVGSQKPLSNLNGTITFNNQLIESKQLAMNVGESDLNLGFTLKNYLSLVIPKTTSVHKDKVSTSKPSAFVTLTSKQLRTSDLTSDKKTSSEQAPNEKKGTQTSGWLPGFDLDANVSIDKLVTEKLTFTNARGTASISEGIINLKNFYVNAFQGTIQTRGTLDVRDLKKRPFDLELELTGVESNSLLLTFTSFGKFLFGKLSMSTKLQGDLNDTLGLNPQTLLGDGTVHIFDGKLLGLPLTAKLADALKINELREISFKDWKNTFSISNGRFNIKDLGIDAGTTDFLLDGSHGLDGSLDYGLTVKLPESLSGRIKLEGIATELLQFLKDTDGRVNLNFQVTGTSSDPVIKLDTRMQQELLKKALEQKGKEAQLKLEEALKKKAEEGLKKLLKKP